MAPPIFIADSSPVRNRRRKADRPVEQYRITEIDDHYMSQWLEFGFREMSDYLAKQARFDRYLTERDALDAEV